MANHNLHVFRSLPDSSLFNFPPVDVPEPIAPHPVPSTILRPFNIPENLFKAALDPKVPLTIGALYAITVKGLNIYNKGRNKKPWAISQTRPFFAFVVLHNVFLCVYSAWTFWAMLGGMRRSIASPSGPDGWAGTIDSFCRLHGSSGLGHSIYYNDTTGSFESANPGAPLVNGLPSDTEPGRLWNEGLAFYGWIFYLSKFYEVLDTFIILAKGKLSSTLQTYHHAGAMLCMWAGIRYMSAPIWQFVLINSFIHSLMYFYYTLTAFGVKVPTSLKRTLTSMQITQFIFGASNTVAHSFFSYTIPVTVTHSTNVPVDAPSAPADSILPTVAAGAIDSLKQLIFGAGADVVAPAASGSAKAQTESTLTTETSYITQPCILTTGETFAIWINVLYLAPLTYLFVSFFIASYVKRSNAASKLTVANGKNASSRRMSNVILAEKAGWDAARGLEEEVYGGEAMIIAREKGHSSAVTEDETEEVAQSSTPKKSKARRRG